MESKFQHVVIVPRYKYLQIYQFHKDEAAPVLENVCRQQNVIVHRMEMASDHVRFVVTLPPKLRRGGFVRNLQQQSRESILAVCPEIPRSEQILWYYHSWGKAYSFGADEQERKDIAGFVKDRMHMEKRCHKQPVTTSA